MQVAATPIGISKPALWTGRVISGLMIAFLALDAVMKIVIPAPVKESFVRLGFPLSASVPLGIVLLLSTVAYAIRRTSVLGAIVLTGYLGGAVAVQVYAKSSAFETVFPAIFGILVWLGLYLRDEKLRAMIPLRS